MADHKDQTKIKKMTSSHGTGMMSDGEYYPYGTSLSIDDELIDELDIGGLAVGDVVEIRGFAFVEGTSEHSDKDHSNKSIRLQMTSIKLEREDDDRAVQLYGDQS